MPWCSLSTYCSLFSICLWAGADYSYNTSALHPGYSNIRDDGGTSGLSALRPKNIKPKAEKTEKRKKKPKQNKWTHIYGKRTQMKNKSTAKPDESQCIKFDYIQERLRAKSFIPCMVSCHYHATCDLNGANAVVLHAPYNYRFHQCFTFISPYFTLAFARTS